VKIQLPSEPPLDPDERQFTAGLSLCQVVSKQAVVRLRPQVFVRCICSTDSVGSSVLPGIGCLIKRLSRTTPRASSWGVE
jgi:hypothetical protein